MQLSFLSAGGVPETCAALGEPGFSSFLWLTQQTGSYRHDANITRTV